MADLIQEQATTYTPGENDLVYNTVVTMGSYSSPQPVVIKQYDSLPIIAAKMRKDGNDYQVPDGAAVNIRLHKRSGTFVYSSVKGISQDRKTAYIQLTSNMTAVYGRTMPCLEIVVNGSVACTGDMVWDIQRNPVQEDDVKDTSEGQYIQEMAAQVQAFEDKYQEALDYMNDATNQSRINNAASNAQEAQQAATDAANSADEAEEEANRAATESAKALGFRSFHGGQVVPGATDGDLDPSRPMSTPTAASVTIKARGDRIAGLTMAGKTTQEGTGDPSPDNIRMISGVGMYDQCVVLDGSEKWIHQTGWRNSLLFYSGSLLPADSDAINADSVAVASSNRYSVKAASVLARNANTEGFGLVGRAVYLAINGITTEVDLKEYLTVHPLTIWYRSVDYAKSTGPFYAVVELSQDPYRAVGFELNAPLFDGDSLKVGGKSGFDKMVVVDGSKDFGTTPTSSGTQRLILTRYIPMKNIQAPATNYVVGEIASSQYPARTAGETYSSVMGISVEGAGQSAGGVFVYDPDIQTNEAAKAYFQSHPLTIFYKSVNYTEENDIPVALESHVKKLKLFDGTEAFNYVPDYFDHAIPDVVSSGRNVASAKETQKASHGIIDNADAMPGSNYYWAYTLDPREHQSDLINRIRVRVAGASDIPDLKSFLSSQYSAGTPVTIVYELATPASYARPVPTMIAQPGEDGTFTVTGENSLSVLLKPFQDGGDAARLNGHTWDDIMAAIDEKIASLASTVMEAN